MKECAFLLDELVPGIVCALSVICAFPAKLKCLMWKKKVLWMCEVHTDVGAKPREEPCHIQNELGACLFFGSQPSGMRTCPRHAIGWRLSTSEKKMISLPPSSVWHLQKGCRMLFKIPIPLLPLLCVLVIEQQSDGCDHTNLGLGQQITVKRTGRLARIKPSCFKAFFKGKTKTDLLINIYSSSNGKWFIVWETGGLRSLVKDSICLLSVITTGAFMSWTTNKDHDYKAGR